MKGIKRFTAVFYFAAIITVLFAIFSINTFAETTASKNDSKFYEYYKTSKEEGRGAEITDITGLYVNGAAMKKYPWETESDKVDYKSVTVYSDMVSKEIDPDGDGKQKAKKGKIFAVVTSSAAIPSVSNGSIAKDTSAADVLKVSYSDKNNDGDEYGIMKLSVNKKPGNVYVHLLDISCAKEVVQHSVLPVTVGEASSKITVTNENDEEVKNIAIEIGESTTVNINPLNKSGEIAKDADLDFYWDQKFENDEKPEKGASYYIAPSLKYNKDYGTYELNIEAHNMMFKEDKHGCIFPKATKVSFSIIDLKSNKKISISVTITANTHNVEVYDLYRGENLWATESGEKIYMKNWWKYAYPQYLLYYKGDKVELAFWKVGNYDDYTTDKMKFLVCSPGSVPTINENNKITYTKSNAVSLSCKYRKCEEECNVLTLKANEDEPSCDIYAVCTDSYSKTTRIFKLLTVTKGLSKNSDGIVMGAEYLKYAQVR